MVVLIRYIAHVGVGVLWLKCVKLFNSTLEVAKNTILDRLYFTSENMQMVMEYTTERSVVFIMLLGKGQWKSWHTDWCRLVCRIPKTQTIQMFPRMERNQSHGTLLFLKILNTHCDISILSISRQIIRGLETHLQLVPYWFKMPTDWRANKQMWYICMMGCYPPITKSELCIRKKDES